MNHPVYDVNILEGIYWISFRFSEFNISNDAVLLGISLINQFPNYSRNKEYNNRESKVRNFAKYKLQAKRI
jgi:hypothetical protein